MKGKIISIDKAMRVLKRLAKVPYEMSAKELSDELNINRSTVHRILDTLKEDMFVLQRPLSRKYTIGPTAYHIGTSYITKDNNHESIKHILEWVAKETQQSIGYAQLEGDKIVNVYEIESYQPVKIGYRPGSFYPIHCGAYGKTIMAFFEPKERLKEIVYGTDLFRKTPHTITDPEVLLKEFEEIRKKGYAISDEESLMGAIGVGAPVQNSKGEVVACVAAAAIKGGLEEKDLKNIEEKVIEGAKKISRIMI